MHGKPSPKLPLKQFLCSSDWWWPILFLSRKMFEHFLIVHRFFGWLCNAISISVSLQLASSSACRIRDTSHLWRLLCLPVCLVISLHSDLFRAAHLQEFLKVHVKHSYMPVLASHSGWDCMGCTVFKNDGHTLLESEAPSWLVFCG